MQLSNFTLFKKLLIYTIRLHRLKHLQITDLLKTFRTIVLLDTPLSTRFAIFRGAREAQTAIFTSNRRRARLFSHNFDTPNDTVLIEI